MELEDKLQISKPCEAVYVFLPLHVPTYTCLGFGIRILFDICILLCEEKDEFAVPMRLCYGCTTW